MMWFSLEDIRIRFPHLFEDIFDLLNQKDLAKFREVNRCLKERLEKIWWMRKVQCKLKEIQCQLKNSYPEFNNDWRLVIKRASLDSLKKFQGCLVRFLDNIDGMNSANQYLSPIIVLSAFGEVKLFKEILVILRNKYPKPKRLCLLHIAALYGNLDTLRAIVKESVEKNPSSKNCKCLRLHGATRAAASGRLELFQYMIQTFEEVYESCTQQVRIKLKKNFRAYFGGKYLVFRSSHLLKMRELSFSQF